MLADGNLATWSNACGVAANWCISTRSPDDAKLTGTSFAAPVVAATAALVQQAYPGWTTAPCARPCCRPPTTWATAPASAGAG
ncbi:S8 family serine peptidase [Achromobacter insuavis]